MWSENSNYLFSSAITKITLKIGIVSLSLVSNHRMCSLSISLDSASKSALSLSQSSLQRSSLFLSVVLCNGLVIEKHFGSNWRDWRCFDVHQLHFLLVWSYLDGWRILGAYLYFVPNLGLNNVNITNPFQWFDHL